MRLLIKWLLTFTVLIWAIGTIFLAVLQSPYGTDVVQHWLKWQYKLDVRIAKVDYQFRHPWQITLHKIADQTSPTQAEHIQIRLTPWHLPWSHWSFERIHLQSANITSTFPLQHFPPMQIHTLTLAQSQWRYRHGHLSSVDIRVRNWHNLPNVPTQYELAWQVTQGEWQGQRFQHWQGELQEHGDHWQFNGEIAWENNQAHFAGQWHKASRRLHLSQLRLAPFYLSSNQAQYRLNQFIQKQKEHIHIAQIHIDRLSLQQGHLALDEWEIDDLTLEWRDWRWPEDRWQQNGELHLSARAMTWQQHPFENVLLKMHFAPNRWQITQAEGQTEHGDWQFAGTFSPEHWHFSQISLSGVHASEQLPLRYLDVWPKKITLDELYWTNGQYLDPSRQFHLAHSDLIAEDIALHWSEHWQATSGQITLNAHEGQWFGRPFSNAIARWEKTEQHWQLSQFVLPLTQGDIQLKGQLNTEHPDWPWQLDIQAEDLPADLLIESLGLPLKMTGKWRISGVLSGSAQSPSAFKHSLTGNLYGEGQELKLHSPKHSPQLDYWAKWQPDELQSFSERPPEYVTITPWLIEIDRGRIHIPPILLTSDTLTAQLKGNWDLVQGIANEFVLDAQSGCQQLHRRWPDPQGLTALSECDSGNNKYVP